MNLFRKQKPVLLRPTPDFWEALFEIHGKWKLNKLVDLHFHPEDLRGDDFLCALNVLNRWIDIALEEGWIESDGTPSA